MSQNRRTFLRDLMTLAWGLFRADRSRGFADALTGAWRWMKRRGERAATVPSWAKGTHSRTAILGSMLQSPIRRSLSGQTYAEPRARAAGYLTSRIGASR